MKLKVLLGALKEFRRNNLSPGLLAGFSCPKVLGDAQEKVSGEKALPVPCFLGEAVRTPQDAASVLGPEQWVCHNSSVFQSFP